MQLAKSKVSSTKLTECDQENEENCRVLTILPSTRTNYVPFQTIMIAMNLQIVTTAIKTTRSLYMLMRGGFLVSSLT